MDKWDKINIRTETLNRIKKFLKTRRGMKSGYTNPTQFVDDAIRRRFDDLHLSRFEHFNAEDNVIRVLDNDIEPLGDIVEVFIKNNNLICSYCKEQTCIHIKYIWTQESLINELRKHGLKPPND